MFKMPSGINSKFTVKVNFDMTSKCVSVDGQSSVYDSARWLKTVKEGFKCDVAWLEVFTGSQLTVRLPLIIRKKMSILFLGSPIRGVHTEFGGRLASDLVKKGVLSEVHFYLRKYGAHWIEFAFFNDSNMIGEEMTRLGYICDRRISRVIDLNKTVDAIWTDFPGRARNEIRKAVKNGLKVCRLGPHNNEEYQFLVESVFKLKRRNASFKKPFLDALHSNLHDSEIHHYGIFIEEKLVAGGIFLSGNGRLVFISGASNILSRKLGANSLIQWRAIQDAQASGVQLYDMGGSGIQEIDTFKKSFGGEEVAYNRYLYNTPLVKILYPIYRFAHSNGWVG